MGVFYEYFATDNLFFFRTFRLCSALFSQLITNKYFGTQPFWLACSFLISHLDNYFLVALPAKLILIEAINGYHCGQQIWLTFANTIDCPCPILINYRTISQKGSNVNTLCHTTKQKKQQTKSL